MILIAQMSPLGGIGMSLLGGLLSVGLILTGRYSIVTKTAKATKLEKLMANKDGKLTGGMAVLKGYMLMLGGVVLLLLSLVLLVVAFYQLIAG